MQELLFLKIISGLIPTFMSTEYYQYVDIRLLKFNGRRVILKVVGVKVSESYYCILGSYKFAITFWGICGDISW